MLAFCFTAFDRFTILEDTPADAFVVELDGALNGMERVCRFLGRCAAPPPAPFSLWFGDVCIASFGPAAESDVSVALGDLFALDRLKFEARGVEALETPLIIRAAGNIFVIQTLDNEERIIRHLQNRPTRFRERELLRLGAKHAFNANPADFVLRAMSIVILGYRLLDSPKRAYSPQDREELDWILAQCRDLASDGTATLAGPEPHDWRVYRWTLSVAKLAGYLAISIEEYALASMFFGFANGHVDWVQAIPASGANIATMTCMNGLLLLYLGRDEEAKASLLLCVERMKWLIAQQNLYLSVSSYSESREIVRTACQAFTLLSLIDGLPKAKRRPQLQGRRFDLNEVWPFVVHKMILGGRCRKLKDFMITRGLAHEAEFVPVKRSIDQ